MPEEAPRERPVTLPLADRLARRLRSRRVVVRNESMRPALEPGDRLLVDPRAYARAAPARGDLVVLPDPERPDRLLVKRVVGVAGDADPGRGTVPAGHVTVAGDNPAGRDSRRFGPVPLDRLAGRVWFRYLPAGRRARFPP